MTDLEPPPRPDAPAATPMGVVDPIRVPGAGMVTGFWGTLPILGRMFLVAAVVDIVARALGIAGLSLFIDLAHPLTILGFLPHLAFVLLPVAVLWRRPDATAETPLVLAGAIALALVELLSGPLFQLLPLGATWTAWTVLQLLSVGARTGGYVLLALGLKAVTRSSPGQGIQGLANLALWVLGGSAMTSMVLVILMPGGDVGDPLLNQQIPLINTVASIPLLGFAYLAQAVVRGTADLRRPVIATYTATGAVLLAVFLHALTLLMNLLAILQRTIALSPGTVGGGIAPELALLGAAGEVLLVVAFALGLADTSVRIAGQRRAGAPDPLASIHWPSPGGEVPAYRPVEWPAETTFGAGPASTAGMPEREAEVELEAQPRLEGQAELEAQTEPEAPSASALKPAAKRTARAKPGASKPAPKTSKSAGPKPTASKPTPAPSKPARKTTRKSKESGA